MNITEFSYLDKRFGMREYFAEVVAQLLCESMEQMNLDSFSTSLQRFYHHVTAQD